MTNASKETVNEDIPTGNRVTGVKAQTDLHICLNSGTREQIFKLELKTGCLHSTTRHC